MHAPCYDSCRSVDEVCVKKVAQQTRSLVNPHFLSQSRTKSHKKSQRKFSLGGLWGGGLGFFSVRDFPLCF